MKRFICLLIAAAFLLPTAYAQERGGFELTFLFDGAYNPNSAQPLFLSTLGVGFRLANGALFARASADLSVPAADISTPATLLSRSFEIGSAPVPGFEAGVRFVFDANNNLTCSIYIHIEQRIKLF
jgi:hypothetical protein